ncbi:MAG: DNA polymerase-3 subunit delta' [Chlamydiales bacterium]|jgi:DNA polymerase-3 subunit delta'
MNSDPQASLTFDDLIGNDIVKGYLESILTQGKLGNSILFSGPEGIGKSLFAYDFSTKILCQDDPEGHHLRKVKSGNHPDIHVCSPEGKIGMHSIRSMRQLAEEVYMLPNEGKWKVFIIHDAERMLPTSANALLKTFEEPASHSIIILLSSSPEALLPTITSRCRKVRFRPVLEKEIEMFLRDKKQVPQEEANRIALQARGSLGRAIRLLENGEEATRSRLLDILVKGRMNSYFELSKIALEFEEVLDDLKKSEDDELRQQLNHEMKDLSAIQREAIEKEIEGALSLKNMTEAEGFFDIILSWHRDLHLVQSGGNPHYLIHRDRQKDIIEFASQSDLQPLDRVIEAISDTKLALQRSIKFSVCFENLFLKLNYL